MEISNGFHRAREFNLDAGKLRATVLEPWVRGRMIALGDHDWEPRDSRLQILEGPELVNVDLSMGRGWSTAEKTGENVTRRLIDEAAAPSKPIVAILAQGEAAQVQVGGMLERLELETTPWAELRAKILSPPAAVSGPGYAAVLVTDSADPTSSWLFDAGLARGALGRRAVVAQLGEASIPAQLAGVDVIRLMPDDEASLRALGDRLAR